MRELRWRRGRSLGRTGGMDRGLASTSERSGQAGQRARERRWRDGMWLARV
ncbi:MAG: hypothetical protein ACQEXQ_04875 [Bacillota bacterium]